MGGSLHGDGGRQQHPCHLLEMQSAGPPQTCRGGRCGCRAGEVGVLLARPTHHSSRGCTEAEPPRLRESGPHTGKSLWRSSHRSGVVTNTHGPAQARAERGPFLETPPIAAATSVLDPEVRPRVPTTEPCKYRADSVTTSDTFSTKAAAGTEEAKGLNESVEIFI